MMGWAAGLACFTALLLAAEWWEAPGLRWFAKPLASASFLGLADSAGVLVHPWGGWMMAGFVGCWWGDVLLIPKDRRVFLAGIGAFLLGHVGFAAAFMVRGVEPVRMGIAATLLVPVAIGVMRWLLPHLRGVMRVAVPAYVVVICTMVAAAVGTTGVAAGGNGVGLAVGAVLFWLSDLCVARQRFVEPGFVNRAVGLPLYYGAQGVLAMSVWGGL
jgi:uncharacterized membrane protein YhhN